MLLRLHNSFASMGEMAREQERIANNLANANTIGYKSQQSFAEAINERLDAEGSPVSERAVTQYANLDAGAYEETGNPLDVALDGEGFFVVMDADNETPRYTRAGRFQLDDQGGLRDSFGRAVQGDAGPISFGSDNGTIEVTAKGEILMDGNSVGKLRIVTFDDPLQLRRTSGGAFDAGEMPPLPIPPDDPTYILQGKIESSNVNAVSEMTEMIQHLRIFESQQRALRAADEVLRSSVRELAKF